MTPIKAIYNGIQDGPHPFELWTILEPMGCTCHGQFSSLSINTIHAHGFEPVEEKEQLTMKTVFTSQQCVHVWAQQTQHEGRNGNRSIFFEGPSIYSYGRHFEMARFVEDVVLVNCARYSVTTSKHQSWVRRAITQYASFEVPSMEDHSANVTYLIDQSRDHYDKALRARKYQDALLTDGRMYKVHAEEYIEKFGVAVPESHTELWRLIHTNAYVKSDVQEALLRNAREAQAKEEQARQAREAKQRAQEAEQLEKWKAGELGMQFFSAMALRVKGDVVETSHGAKVPIIEARKLYRLLQIRKTLPSHIAPQSIKGHRIGHFTVNRLTETEIVIGCHTVPLDEIERIAPAVMAYKKQVEVCEDCLGIDGHEANCYRQGVNRG